MTDILGAPLVTLDDLAAYLGMTPERVQKLTVQRGWPCVWVSRRIVRYTPEHVAAIVAECTRGRATVLPSNIGVTVLTSDADIPQLVETQPFGHRSRKRKRT